MPSLAEIQRARRGARIGVLWILIETSSLPATVPVLVALAVSWTAGRRFRRSQRVDT